MSLKRFLVACKSFIKNLIKLYFSVKYINKGFFYALLVSNFIFLSLIDNIFLEFISPFLAIYGVFKLIDSAKFIYFWFGIFIGILWFYWISFSLIYYNFTFLIPIEIIFITLVYGIIFLLCGYFNSKIYRVFSLLLVSFIHPFSFDWMNLELILINGIFQPNFRGLAAILIGILAFYSFKKFRYFYIILGLIFALQIEEKKPNFLPFNVELINTKISQFDKWNDKFTPKFIKENLNSIDKAINSKKDLIIFPENAMPLFLNKNNYLIEILKEKSQFIDILIGASTYENSKFYNSSYLFTNSKMQIFHKFILVPFGEEIPVPNFIKNIINSLFFSGASDFSKAENFSYYELKNIKIKNAICYEATRDELYKDDPKFIIAISNNAWFLPSTQPILQNLIIKYQATKHNSTIYHSVNGSKSEIIEPKKLWVKKFFKKFMIL